jgi:hypothetical protein
LTHSFWFLAVDALAVYRLAVLFSQDKITDWLRTGLRERGYQTVSVAALGGERTTVVHRPGIIAASSRWLFELVECPWCVSIWFAALAVILTRFWPEGWQYPAMLLALSAVAGWLGERTNH